MRIRKISCPYCRTSMDVPNPEDKEFVRFACPVCKRTLNVQFDINDTVIVNPTSKKEIGYLMCGGERYDLKEGINTVGRKSSCSEATIQIATNDNHVSRVHAEIEVVKLKNGHIKAILRDARVSENTSKDKLEGIKKNPMIYCDEKMYLEDRIDLENGDTFKMGGLTVKYLQ